MTASEAALNKLLADNGYRVLRNGWPDFFVAPPDGGPSFAVELKSDKDRVRPHEKEMHAALEAAGVKVMVAKEETSADNREADLDDAVVHLEVPEDTHRTATTPAFLARELLPDLDPARAGQQGGARRAARRS